MNNILKEAKRLYDLQFAILWLKPESKRPVKFKWTTGPRETWDTLSKSYQEGFNVGVRLGPVSDLGDGHLGVVDHDVKSSEPRHRIEAEQYLDNLYPGIKDVAPKVQSGRGNGSAHYYVKVDKSVLKGGKLARSKEMVKVFMPSSKPSAHEQKTLTQDELSKGVRIRAAWEIRTAN